VQAAEVELARLAARARRCRRCPAMAGRRRVLGPANGPPGTHIVLVGEAPGRLGADRTGRPFVGDASGRRLDRLLAEAGWSRADVFITNAVLCNPRDPRGRNRPPSGAELRACGDHLRQTLLIVRPRLVVALGRRAALALGRLRPHALADTEPGTLLRWSSPGEPDVWVARLVHPSPLAQAHRPFATQCADWRRLRAAYDQLPGD
jgi:uracil-DNA glycosylase